MTPRRILQIRFWLLAVAGLVACCFAPEAFGVLVYGGFATTPLGLMMPVFAGSSSSCPTICSTVPNSVSVSFSGITTGGFCDCSPFNAGVVFSSPPALTCSQGKTLALLSGFCLGVSGFASYNIVDSGGNIDVRTSLGESSGSGTAGFASGAIVSAPTDCSALGTPSLSPTTHANGNCNYDGAGSSAVFS
jgi:hypothetical protein